MIALIRISAISFGEFFGTTLLTVKELSGSGVHYPPVRLSRFYHCVCHTNSTRVPLMFRRVASPYGQYLVGIPVMVIHVVGSKRRNGEVPVGSGEVGRV